MGEVLDRALRMAQGGWAVFPLAPGTKIPPKGSNGFHDATTDPARVAAAFAALPSANIGVATGRPSGVFVVDLDIDPEKGKDGLRELAKLEKQHGKLSETLTVLTPHEGRHLYFKMPSGIIKSAADVLAPGIDIRGDGGYVVASGNVVEGKPYKVLNAHAPADAPAWLIQAARNGVGQPKSERPINNSVATSTFGSLDVSKLENVQRHADGSMKAACPACRANGEDHTGNHLLIRPEGKFGCAKYADDYEHRRAIWQIVGQWNSTDVHGAIVAILTNPKLSPPEQRTRIAETVVNALLQRGRFFFHAERRNFDTAMFFDAERKRLERICSDAFLAWLSDWLHVNRADTVFKYIAAQIETVALSGNETTGIVPETFFAAQPGAIYLSNGDGLIVRVKQNKVEMVDNGTDGVLFAAGSTLPPWTLKDPQDPFATCALFRDAKYAAKHGLELARLWVLSLPTLPACKPPLCNAGPIGSGKTRFGKGVAELYGLPIVIAKIEDSERGEDNFWVSMDAGGVFVADNCDTHNRWLADAVAAAATDGCSQRRRKFKDAETVTLRARAWLCLTTANPTFASDAGLADRLIVVRMDRRTDETSDARLSDEIAQNRDSGLSFIAHTLSAALADIDPTPSGLNQRHPDFASFAVRIGRALDLEAEAVAALKAAESDKSAFCLENDTLGVALLNFMQDRNSWHGTAANLLEALKEADPEFAALRQNGKPEWSSKRVGKRLAALWPHVQKVFKGSVEKDRKGFSTYSFEPVSAEFAEFDSTK